MELTEQRTRLDFALTIRWLVDEVYPDARVIRLVMDNLNTHTAASRGTSSSCRIKKMLRQLGTLVQTGR